MLLKKSLILILLAGIYFFSFIPIPMLYESERKNSDSLEKRNDIKPNAESDKDELEPIKILIVPGHDEKSNGAKFGSLKESDMTLELGTQIFEKLKEDERYEVWITRDLLGYTPLFAEYFSENKEAIISFTNEAKKKMKEKIEKGDFTDNSPEPIYVVTPDTGVKLYGINKWANENQIDIVVHIHFNDHTRKKKSTAGKYKGFAIYYPEEQMPNYGKSLAFAKSIFGELSTIYKTSDNVRETGGLVANQDLIVLGSNETLFASVGSVLIEYGYIYEFKDTAIREKAYENMTERTIKGISDFFLRNSEGDIKKNN